ncbi:protein of unknown function [Kyrpidia spormannii]|uniref:Uncharacterized protein n=1 Tax=Kyrpidia spormannii TaxID=2055160 RepID=A0A6F9EHG5_9BACL|nr:protein of unknown function [Kyrpidia spormannii]
MLPRRMGAAGGADFPVDARWNAYYNYYVLSAGLMRICAQEWRSGTCRGGTCSRRNP